MVSFEIVKFIQMLGDLTENIYNLDDWWYKFKNKLKGPRARPSFSLSFLLLPRLQFAFHRLLNSAKYFLYVFADNGNPHEWEKIEWRWPACSNTNMFNPFQRCKREYFQSFSFRVEKGLLNVRENGQGCSLRTGRYSEKISTINDDDRYLNPHLSKDYESFDFNWYYSKTGNNKFYGEEKICKQQKKDDSASNDHEWQTISDTMAASNHAHRR